MKRLPVPHAALVGMLLCVAALAADVLLGSHPACIGAACRMSDTPAAAAMREP